MRKSAFIAPLLGLLIVVPSAAQQSDQILAVKANVVTRAAPAQPLPFSHKKHVDLGLVCQMCHTNPEPRSQMTYPATETCMSCHAAVATDTPAIESLHSFSASGDEIPWVRVYAVTPGVIWGHKAHLDAGAQCETCHGDISQAEAVSETTSVLAMATCISCHQALEAASECVTCHAWPTDQLLGIE
jgi:hypothetical protein